MATVPAMKNAKPDLIFSWSGGKDSALGLYEIRRTGASRIAALLTTVSDEYDRVSMHGVRRVLLTEQARSLGLPLRVVRLPAATGNQQYEEIMAREMAEWKARGVTGVVFADLFLADLRRYREENLSKLGLAAHFPIWQTDTAILARKFIALGFQAVITCVDTQFLDRSFAGRTYDEKFLADLPAGIDPCGENGEFHSFVFAGPGFAKAVGFTKGEVVLREDRFAFCDLVPWA